MLGHKFTEDMASYILSFGGDNYRCGSSGAIYLSNVSATRMELMLVYEGALVSVSRCKDYDLSKEPLFPLSIPTKLTLTKQ